MNGSNGQINLYNAQASVIGNSDIVFFAIGSNNVSVSGNYEQFIFNQGFGVDSISGFLSSTDHLSFSHSDYSNFAAIQSHMSQSGGNTIISGNAGYVTLVGVNQGSLSSSNFSFY